MASTWFPKRRGLAVGYVACGASVAGVIYPSMLRYLIKLVGFNDAVRYVATLTSVTCIFSFIFCTPDPAHEHHEPKTWGKLTTWFDTEAFRNKAFCWFTAAVAFMFFGFYPVFFNLEEVSFAPSLPSKRCFRLTLPSGQQYAASVLAIGLLRRQPRQPSPTNPLKPSGCL